MSKWPMVPLGEVLTPVSRAESVDPVSTYRMLGARWYARGLYVKDTLIGTEIQAPKVYRIQAGDFVFNRLFAWKGSFAVASEDIDGCCVSNEFPCFEVSRNRIDPYFLWRYFSRESVWNEALGLSTGGTPTSRNRLKEAAFLSLEIPLPPLSEQQRIAAWIDAVATRVEQAESEAEATVNRLANLLMSAFREIAEGLPERPLGEVAPLTRRPAEIDPAAEYPGISARSFGRGTFHNPPLLGSEITWQKPYQVKTGDILVSNIKAWEGAIAVVSPEDDGRFGSHRYLTFSPKVGVATPRFVCFYLLSSKGLHYVGEASPGSADRNRTTGSRAMQKIPVPLAPYQRQLWFEQLYEKVEEAKKVIAQAREERAALLPSLLNDIFTGEGDG